MTWRASVSVQELGRTATWEGAAPVASVVVATCDRSPWLPGLLASLEAQTVPVEVVVVDDASTDGTAAWLAEVQTALPLLALTTSHRSGPSAARNAGADRARSPLLLLTDDDCLPAPEWAAALVAALSHGSVVQGQTLPTDEGHGPWDRSIEVRAVSALYETCNLGVRADAFREVGGFTELGLLRRPGARGFGEDAELGTQLGAAAWVPEALVRHRWINATWADHLEGRRRLEGFPALAGLVPQVEDRLAYGVGLSRRTLLTDLALVSLAVAAVGPSLCVVGTVPWLMRLRREARDRPGRAVPVRAAQLAVADVVGVGALLRGSLRSRKLVL